MGAESVIGSRYLSRNSSEDFEHWRSCVQVSGVGDDVTRGPREHLACVEGTATPASLHFRRPAVLAPDRFPCRHEHVQVHSPQRAIAGQSTIVSANRAAWREFPRRHPPLAAGAGHVHDCVRHFAQLVARSRPLFFAGRKHLFNQEPLPIRQVACVARRRPAMPSAYNFNPYFVSARAVEYKRENLNRLFSHNSFWTRHRGRPPPAS